MAATTVILLVFFAMSAFVCGEQCFGTTRTMRQTSFDDVCPRVSIPARILVQFCGCVDSSCGVCDCRDLSPVNGNDLAEYPEKEAVSGDLDLDIQKVGGDPSIVEITAVDGRPEMPGEVLPDEIKKKKIPKEEIQAVGIPANIAEKTPSKIEQKETLGVGNPLKFEDKAVKKEETFGLDILDTMPMAEIETLLKDLYEIENITGPKEPSPDSGQFVPVDIGGASVTVDESEIMEANADQEMYNIPPNCATVIIEPRMCLLQFCCSNKCICC